MSRTTSVTTDGAGNVIATTRSKTSFCGCGGLLTLLVAVFCVYAPGYYAAHDNWPLGWAGAVLAYVVMAGIIIAAVAAAMKRQRPVNVTPQAPPPPMHVPSVRRPIIPPPPPPVR